jgi:hypothetical protein
MMTMREICVHDRAGMETREEFGYDQHDSHVWCWLIEMLRLWGLAHPWIVG